MRTRASARSAFTLIELLVVIAVIALLVAIMLPSLGGARRAAKGTVCLSGLRSIGQAVTLYCDDHKGYFPLSSHAAGSLIAPNAWLITLQEYGVSPTFRKCPLDPFREERITSYATNEHFEPLTPGLDFNPITRRPIPGGRKRPYQRIDQVPRPYATIYAYEPEGTGAVDHLHTHQIRTVDQLRAAVAVTRHLGASHFVYVDGHAAPWPWSDLRTRFSPETSPFDPETAQ
ncbi:MAG: type II secretion system protein [Phycisphaeraceae bacterium]|nr:type II secretion system protein [Phycisphaeraceae bacterium]MBX3367645.1 type II secretion system protein [Phycisphaeraceae bacterium]